MGVRLTPIDLSWGNSSTFTTNINQNFDDIATLLDTFLSRTDATTNFMDVALDMNSNDINNAGTIRCDVLLIDNAQIPSLEDIQEAFVAGQAAIDAAVTGAETAQAAAETAQAGAELAETNAETAQAAAEAAAAGVSLPSIVGGDADKLLVVKDDETGYELLTAPAAIPTAPALLSTTALSGQSTVSLPTIFSDNSQYKYFKVVIEGGIRSVSTGGGVQVTKDSGSSYISGLSTYKYRQNVLTGGVWGGTNENYFPVLVGTENPEPLSSNATFHAELTFFTPAQDTVFNFIECRSFFADIYDGADLSFNTGLDQYYRYGTINNDSDLGAWTGFRLTVASGTYTGGTMYVYGSVLPF